MNLIMKFSSMEINNKFWKRRFNYLNKNKKNKLIKKKKKLMNLKKLLMINKMILNFRNK